MAAQTQLTPEILAPRLGEYLIRRKLITEADLQRALLYQQEQVAAGRTCLLGDLLVELNILERPALDHAITELILQLRNALQDANRNLEKRVQERTAELQEALERLSELSQLKANFVSSISHELRTPLTHIKGYLELLVTQSLGPLTEEQEHALQVSQRSAARLEGLIEDLILFSLSSRGELSIQIERINIKILANQAIKSAQHIAQERGVTVHIVVDEDLPQVHGDVQKISWVLNQLLDNAIKFTPQGGRVVLTAKQESNKLVLVSVVDTGIGIPPERIQEIFEPFHQLDGSSTRRYGGTGLGLSLVRQIIEAHGSLIEVRSTEGNGSTFEFPLLIVGAEN
jgi:signal transduction histidine kinase